jgi:SAM-dependent methyltransferase
MFTMTASLYDLIYSWKNYPEESQAIMAAIRARHPDAKTMLDIGCGTGEHHRSFVEAYEVDGLDLDPAFVEVAQGKNPAGSYFIGDMAQFRLPKRYDVIVCLFSSIGYVQTVEKLNATLRCFYDHLNPGGIVLVEPWFTAETWKTGAVHMLSFDRPEIKLCRMNRSTTRDNCSILHFHYLIGTNAEGVRHLEEEHVLGLFSREEMEEAFMQAGFAVHYDEEGITGRGLYEGKKLEND